MDKENAVNTTLPAAEEKTDATPAIEDVEAKLAVLEADKNRAIEEAANWKMAALKYKSKRKEDLTDDEEDERMRSVAQEVLANSRLAEIAREQDALIKKALKENKELKLAQLNRTTATPPAAVGTHTEAPMPKDTLVTNEQLAAFKARGWTDKDIERYKKNLQKHLK